MASTPRPVLRLAVLAAALGGLATAAPALATFPGLAGRIAFESDRDGNFEIYAMGGDGSGPTRLTTSPGFDGSAAWSPDGSRIAFESQRDGNSEIYLMHADGSLPTRLTAAPGVDSVPTWSPDGQRIAFASDRDGNLEIYVMGADGTGLTRLTDNPGTDAFPSWSPDGSQIAFGTNREGDDEVYVMNADGTNPHPLTTDPGSDSVPDWSPDGARISFQSTRDGNPELYVMNRDGAAQTRLTSTVGDDFTPVWAPDRTRIAFVSARDGNPEIYSMNADGTGVVRLTAHAATDRSPAWAPVPPPPPPPTGAPGIALLDPSPADGLTVKMPADAPLVTLSFAWSVSQAGCGSIGERVARAYVSGPAFRTQLPFAQAYGSPPNGTGQLVLRRPDVAENYRWYVSTSCAGGVDVRSSLRTFRLVPDETPTPVTVQRAQSNGGPLAQLKVPDRRGIPAAQVARAGSALAVTPAKLGLARLARSRCVTVRLQAVGPMTLAASLSGRGSGARTVATRRLRLGSAGRRDACVPVPADVKLRAGVTLRLFLTFTPPRGDSVLATRVVRVV